VAETAVESMVSGELKIFFCIIEVLPLQRCKNTIVKVKLYVTEMHKNSLQKE
jgi:hypothetical protein